MRKVRWHLKIWYEIQGSLVQILGIKEVAFSNADIEGVTKEIFGSKETIDKVIWPFTMI